LSYLEGMLCHVYPHHIPQRGIRSMEIFAGDLHLPNFFCE